MVTGKDGSNRLVLICLGLLNVVLLITAVVLGVNCEYDSSHFSVLRNFTYMKNLNTIGLMLTFNLFQNALKMTEIGLISDHTVKHQRFHEGFKTVKSSFKTHIAGGLKVFDIFL